MNMTVFHKMSPSIPPPPLTMPEGHVDLQARSSPQAKIHMFILQIRQAIYTVYHFQYLHNTYKCHGASIEFVRAVCQEEGGLKKCPILGTKVLNTTLDSTNCCNLKFIA